METIIIVSKKELQLGTSTITSTAYINKSTAEHKYSDLRNINTVIKMWSGS